MSAAPVLSVRDLCVGVAGGPRVVDRLSFDVGEGETLCLVGESGSGKSVTALSVMGLLPPGVLAVTGGAIRLGPGSEAEDLARAAPARMRALRASRMSMIFQEPMTALNPVLPVGRQIAEVLEAHGEMEAPRGAPASSRSWTRCICPSPPASRAPIRTSSRAVSASA